MHSRSTTGLSVRVPSSFSMGLNSCSSLAVCCTSGANAAAVAAEPQALWISDSHATTAAETFGGEFAFHIWCWVGSCLLGACNVAVSGHGQTI